MGQPAPAPHTAAESKASVEAVHAVDAVGGAIEVGATGQVMGGGPPPVPGMAPPVPSIVPPVPRPPLPGTPPLPERPPPPAPPSGTNRSAGTSPSRWSSPPLRLLQPSASSAAP